MLSECAFAEALSAAQQECEQALSEFCGAEVKLSLLSCSESRADELLSTVSQFSQIDEVNLAIVVGIYGDLTGYLVLIIPPSQAEAIANHLLDGEEDPDLRLSVLAEIGNLTTARLLMGLGKVVRNFGQSLITPPATQADFSGALLESLVAFLLNEGQHRVLYSIWQLKVSLSDGDVEGTAHFFLPF